MNKNMKEAIQLQKQERIDNLRRMLVHKKITQEEFDEKMKVL